MIKQNRIMLTEILAHRRNDLQKEMELTPINQLKEEIESSEGSLKSNGSVSKGFQNSKNLRNSLQNDEDVAVIFEYKSASPSKGNISDITLEDALDVFEESGASAVSILTEERYFRGSLNNLISASHITELPLIRKDFLFDEYQIYQTKMAGASAVLLMSGIYPDITEGLSLCRELELDALVECRSRLDLEDALKAGAEIVGINNRNFQDFTVDLKTTEKLAEYVPSNVILVSESGVHGPEDVKKLAMYGADAILIGTSVMSVEGKKGMLNAASRIINTTLGVRVGRK